MQRNRFLFFFLLFILFIFILFSYSCKRTTNGIGITPSALKNHLQNARIFGNVYSIETDTYFYSDKDSIYVFLNKNFQFYNTGGYLMDVYDLNKNNDTISKKTLYYLPNVKENYWEEKNFKEYSFSKDTSIYDINGFKIEERFFLNDTLLYRIEYKTDGIGSIIEMKRFLPEYHLTNKMYYNNDGLVQRIEEYDPQNQLYKFFTIEYDKYGNEVNRCAFKNIHDMIEFTYTQYNNKGWLQKIIFEDCLHNIRENRIYTQYDNKGNWLEEILLQENDTVGKRIRKISYY